MERCHAPCASGLADLAADSWRGYRFTRKTGSASATLPACGRPTKAPPGQAGLLQAQRDELLPETRRELRGGCKPLADAADSRAKRLKSGDMASMEARLKACEGSIAVIAQRLSVVMDAVLAKVDATQRDVQASLGKDAVKSAEVKKREGTDVVERSYEVSTSKFYKALDMGRTRRVYYSTRLVMRTLPRRT